jgi:hypothetical protein
MPPWLIVSSFLVGTSAKSRGGFLSLAFYRLYSCEIACAQSTVQIGTRKETAVYQCRARVEEQKRSGAEQKRELVDGCCFCVLCVVCCVLRAVGSLYHRSHHGRDDR